MADPPHGQKELQQQAIQMGAILDPTGFDVPASTFAILKSGFHPHAPSIFLDASRTGLFIADENPRLLIVLLPRDAHPGVQRLLLPHPGLAKPAIAWLEDELAKGLPSFL